MYEVLFLCTHLRMYVLFSDPIDPSGSNVAGVQI